MRRTATTILVLATLLAMSPRAVEAGCGCTKPPPPPAAMRPDAAYAGAEVTFFDPALKPSAAYTVTFTSGITGASATTQGTVAVRRDLADGQPKPQLVVTVPTLPLGPTRITVSGPGTGPVVLALDDAAFTVVPAPVVVPGWNARMEVKNFQGAVGRDGTFYVALDMTHVDIPLTFQMLANKYPLRFATADVVFYNVQGFVMQLLTGGIPGLAVVDEAVKVDRSNTLQYARHEFTSYFLEHAERKAHAVDPTDPRWHLDGTPHIDHNHLIVAITGYLQGSGKAPVSGAPYNALPSQDAPPVPGATPPFDLQINTSGLFNYGVVGLDGVTIAGAAIANSEIVSNETVALAGTAIVSGNLTADTVTAKDLVSTVGDIKTASAVDISGKAYLQTKMTSNGTVKLHGKSKTIGAVKGLDVHLTESAVVQGNVSGLTVTMNSAKQLVNGSGTPTLPKIGTFTPITVDPNELLPVYLPATVVSSGNLVVATGQVVTLTGPATYRYENVTIQSGGTLAINNAAGGVTLYLTGNLQSGAGQITVVNPDADTFSIYVAGGGDVALPGQGIFHGVVYAPESSIDIRGTGYFEGAFVGRAVTVSELATVTYAQKLGSNVNMRATVQALEALRQTVAKAAAAAKTSATMAASAATSARTAAQIAAAQAATTVVPAASIAAATANNYAIAAERAAAQAAAAAGDAERAVAADAKANDALSVTAAEFAADDATVAAAAAAAALKLAVTAQKNAQSFADTAIKATASAQSAALKSAATAQKAALAAEASAQTAATAATAAATAASKAAATAAASRKITVVAAAASAQSAATGAAQAAADARTAATSARSAAVAASAAAAAKNPEAASAAIPAAVQGQTAAALAAKTAVTAQKSAESYAATAVKAASTK